MSVSVFVALAMVVVITGYALLIYGKDKNNELLRLVGSGMILLAFGTISIVFLAGTGEPKFYGYDIREVSHMDESEEIVVRESVTDGMVVVEYVNEAGINTVLLLHEKDDNYEIIYVDKEA